MGQYDVVLTIQILLTGILILTVLILEARMDKFNQALARLQASAQKSNDKIDTLVAGQTAAVDAALSTAADQVNAVADTLDSKNA